MRQVAAALVILGLGLAGPRFVQAEDRVKTIRVRMKADDNGHLARLELDGKVVKLPERYMGDLFDVLNQSVRKLVKGARVQGVEVEAELDCDYQLRYEYVVKAIRAVSAYETGVAKGRKVVKLVRKIKFAPPRGGASSTAPSEPDGRSESSPED